MRRAVACAVRDAAHRGAKHVAGGTTSPLGHNMLWCVPLLLLVCCIAVEWLIRQTLAVIPP